MKNNENSMLDFSFPSTPFGGSKSTRRTTFRPLPLENSFQLAKQKASLDEIKKTRLRLLQIKQKKEAALAEARVLQETFERQQFLQNQQRLFETLMQQGATKIQSVFRGFRARQIYKKVRLFSAKVQSFNLPRIDA